MILVDSSVWIDYFNGKDTEQTIRMDRLLDVEILAVGDLILTEVLQGFSKESEFNAARKIFANFEMVTVSNPEVALQAAKNFRNLRMKGITVRKTIDAIIATRCIVSGFRLLHNDRDFDPFEKHLGLRCIR
ncbi:MAG: PIN domain nuclease [Steroidobacter sp.]